MKDQIDLSKSLEQLENDYWGEPTYNSHLVTTCHKLRKVPLSEFEPEGLRMIIGQNFSLDILMPLAVKELRKNILVSGAFFDGNLLISVLNSDKDYWIRNPELWEVVCQLFESEKEKLENSKNTAEIITEWFKAFEKFQKIN